MAVLLKTTPLGRYLQGTGAALALGRTKGAVSQWSDDLPLNLQFEIQGRTGGKLKADSAKHSASATPATSAPQP